MPWEARTVKHVLIDRHGMDGNENPIITCACGRTVHADTCVDLTPLPIGIRKHLGLHRVDYLCDGCQTRLFRELHIGEEEFYRLLGAPEEALAIHRARDHYHVIGCELRPDAYKPRHTKISSAHLAGKRPEDIPVAAPIPLSRRIKSHNDAAKHVHLDPSNGIELTGVDLD